VLAAAGSVPECKAVVTILCDRGELYLNEEGGFE